MLRRRRSRPSGRRWSLSLRWRVAVAFGLGSLLVTGMVAVLTWNLAGGYMLRQRELGTATQAEVDVRLVSDALQTGSQRLGELLAGLSSDSQSSVLLRRGDGWITAGRPLDSAVIPAALVAAADEGRQAQQRLYIQGVPVLAVALAVPAEDAVFVQLFPLTELDRSLRYLSIVLIAGVAVSSLLGFLLGAWASRRALHPLTQLTLAASRVASGDLRARLPTQDDPDLAPLADTFNRTAAALEARVRRDERFAGDVSHELRSPLTTMANAAAVLHRRRAEMSGPAGRALELLVPEIDRFRHMVVDLLEISRADEPSADDLDDVDLGELARGALGHRSGCELHIARPAPVIRADRRRLERVLANLLDNADTYAGGPVRVAVLRAGDQARIEVDDAGPGVPSELRTVVFERFARGMFAGRRADGGGTGLGLALVAQHVHRHHGAVWVEARPGGGARFVVELGRRRFVPDEGPPRISRGNIR